MFGLACEQAFYLGQGVQLFTGWDTVDNEYRTRIHIAEMIAILGPPPPDFLKGGKRSSEFFCHFNAHMRLVCTMPMQLTESIVSMPMKSVNAESYATLAYKFSETGTFADR